MMRRTKAMPGEVFRGKYREVSTLLLPLQAAEMREFAALKRENAVSTLSGSILLETAT